MKAKKQTRAERIKELELENKILIAKITAYEHVFSIIGLKDKEDDTLKKYYKPYTVPNTSPFTITHPYNPYYYGSQYDDQFYPKTWC